MQTSIKTLRTIGIILLVSMSVISISNTQSPADDPGIGGPGSPTVGVGGDSGHLAPEYHPFVLVRKSGSSE